MRGSRHFQFATSFDIILFAVAPHTMCRACTELSFLLSERINYATARRLLRIILIQHALMSAPQMQYSLLHFAKFAFTQLGQCSDEFMRFC